jgi:hypothetical protein
MAAYMTMSRRSPGVPSPGGPISWAGVQRAMLHRKSAAFDFTVLCPRVPAVIVSPRMAPGTVDKSLHYHASIPATLGPCSPPAGHR